MKKLSRIFVLFVFCLLSTIMIVANPVTVSAEETTVLYSGTCGTNLTWELDDAGTLTIEGTGAMSTYSYGSAPWYSYRSTITKIVIGNNITNISNGAFYGCSSLEELSVPFVGNSQSIGNSSSAYYHYPLGYMFGTSSYTGGTSVKQYSSNDYKTSSNEFISKLDLTSTYYIPSTLKKVSVTNSKYIFSGAFSVTSGSLNITEITLNEGIEYIGSYAFYSTSDLETINLPTTLKGIGERAFYNCSKLDYVEIPGSVTTIGDYAFYNCSSLTTSIGSNVKSIGNYTFYGCTSLGNQVFKAATTYIGSYAFYGCTSFTEINIPKTITSIGSYAFDGCANVKKITIDEGVKTIGPYAFRGISKVTKLTIPTTVTSMGQGVFSGMSSLEKLSVPFVGNSQSIGNSSSAYYHYPLGYMFGTSSYTGGTSVKQYSSNDYKTSSNEFISKLDLTSTYYIPSTLKKVSVTNSKYIFSGAFSVTSGSLNITEITLNEGIEYIGSYAFYSTSDLETINLPTTLKGIGERAFYNCSKLDYVEIPGSVTKIGDYAFYNCKALAINVLKKSTELTTYSYTFNGVPIVKYFDYYSYTNGNDTFYYNVIDGAAIIAKTVTTNTDLTLPTTLGGYTVTKVANMGVANCTTLTKIAIPANIIELGDYAFSGCTGLTTVTIPSTCLYVGDYAFNGCNNITTTTIAEGVLYVGDYAFFNCSSLESIVIPDTCEYLGKGAFYNCTNMKSASIGIIVPEINDYTFTNCSSMETIVIGLKVTSIGDYAFKNCSSIKAITLRNGVTSVGAGAFMNCSSITKASLAATITEIGPYAFYGCSSLASITVPKLVTVIPESTFEGCTSLTSASYNGTVTKIGNRAFYGTSITAFSFKSGLKHLGSESFSHTKLTSVILPDSLQIIGQHVFDGCELQSVSMPSCVKLDANCKRIFANNGNNMIVTIRFVNDGKLDDYLLYRSNAKQVLIDEGITDIGDYTFARNTFTAITLPNTLTNIGDYAFYLCENLEEVTLPKNTKTIGTYTFAKNFNLKNIYIPDSMESVGSHAFYKVENEEVHELLTVHIYFNEGKICNSLLSSQHMQYVVILDDVLQVGDYVFSACPNLREVYVGDDVSIVGSHVFANCPNLREVYVGDGISSFGNNNFLNDNNVTLEIRKVDGYIDDYVYYDNLLYVTTVIIKEDISAIGKYAFYNDTSLKIISVPNTVNYIGEYAFYNCNSIKEINIPNGVAAIYSHTFFGCSSLESITTPNTVKLIGDYAFYGCVEAKTLTISNSCESIGSNAFYNCKSIKELIIPDSVNTIGTYAFRSCVEITELVFSNNVEEIGACAFYDCNGLRTVKLGKKIIALGDRMFYGCVNLESLYVYAPLSYIDELAFYGADFVTVYCGRDDYMINFFDENGIFYEILDDLVYEYKITFVNENGEIISSATYTSGSTVTLPDNPTKPSDNTYNYVFAGWDQDVTIVGGNKTYTAVFTPVYIDYTVVFKDYNGNTINSNTYHYGDAITIPTDPTRVADHTYTYAFAGWDKTVVDCAGNATYTATYAPTYIDYTVVFKDWNGTVISTETYHYGDKVTVPTDLTRAADNTYTYAFVCWDKAVVDCEGNVTYTATYDATYIDYTVVFKDADGTVLSTNTYHYGDKIIVPKYPTKEADNTYTYAFAGWDKTIVDCAGNATYTATYTPTYINYTVVFKNWNDAVITAKTYHYGDKITVPTDPTKASDNTYTYTFAGWDSIVVDCAGNATYTATYTPVYINYTVIFKDEDGREISKNTYHWGETIVIPADPMKDMDQIGSYSFAGWDKDVVACNGNATYTATYTIDYTDYTVVFKNWNGDVISSKTYHWGDSIVVPGSPTKAADNTYTYSFAGWDKAVDDCAGNVTYTATYTPTYINYTIVFKNWNGTVLSTKTYHYGDKVTIPTTPVKAADNTYTYTFAGWDKTIVNCAGDVTYTATYTPVYINYTIIFKDEDGSEISKKNYHWGDVINVPTHPTKATDQIGTYSFAGWDKNVVACAGNAIYTATYTVDYTDYTVVFKNWNGDVISTKTYHWGDSIVVPGNPTKAADNTYTYAFAGWDKTVVNCAGNTTYTATYRPTYINYTVVFKNWNGTVLSTKTYHYGDKVTVPTTPTKTSNSTYTYTFAGWDKTVVNCAGNATYTATFTPVYINYTITFKNWDGSVLTTNTYHYGDIVQEPNAPTKESDLYGTYLFSGWDKSVTNCAGDATYIATYKTEYTDYVVKFQNWNGTIISSKTYHYGDKVTVPSNPSKSADNTYTYTFAGWDKTVINCAGNTTYTATYTPTYIDYTIVFKNWNGTILSTKTYHYGDKVTVPADPTKESDNTFTYDFAGWDKPVADCADTSTYTATYTSNYIDYTIVFNNWNGELISSSTYHYGDVVELPEEPTKEKDGYYIYTFAGWNSEVIPCAGNAEYKAVFDAEHYHTYKTSVINPTCTNKGYTKNTCACGNTYNDKFVNSLGHTYSNNCDTSCNVCKATRTITHTYKTTTTKATLTKNGCIVKKCTVCGKVASNTAIKYAKTFKLSTTTYTYNGKVKTPSVTVKDSAGKTLKKNTDYTVTYASGRKNVGTYKVTIKMKGKYSGTKTLTFKINPAKTTVSKLTAGKKSITVAITKKSTQVTGYQIQYSTSKKFTNAKTKTISSYKITKYTLKSLSAKKTYYVRVRTYKTVGKTKYYSGWSTYKYVKTK